MQEFFQKSQKNSKEFLKLLAFYPANYFPLTSKKMYNFYPAF